MEFSGLEQTGKSIESLGITLQRLAEVARKICEWLAEVSRKIRERLIDYFSSEEFRERIERARREVEARKRRRKQFAEWSRAEEQRRAAKYRQYERVFIAPSGRQYFRNQHRARKPP